MRAQWISLILISGVMATSARAQADHPKPAAGGSVITIAQDNPAADADSMPQTADHPKPAAGGSVITIEQDNPAADTDSVPETQDTLNTYEEQMALVTTQTYTELAQIAQAVRAGEISSDEAEHLTRRSYERGMIRLQFLDTLHQIIETKVSNEGARQKPGEQNQQVQTSEETLVVAPPDSSPDIPESLAKYLELTPVQIAAIQTRVVEEQRQVRPLLQQLSHNREALTTAIHMQQSSNSNRQIRQLAVEQSHILERIIVASSRLQRDIYKTLTDAQRERLDDMGQDADVTKRLFAGR